MISNNIFFYTYPKYSLLLFIQYYLFFIVHGILTLFYFYAHDSSLIIAQLQLINPALTENYNIQHLFTNEHVYNDLFKSKVTL